MKTLKYKGFVGSISQCEESGDWHGRILNSRECDIISYASLTEGELEKEFRETVDEYLKDLEEIGVFDFQPVAQNHQ